VSGGCGSTSLRSRGFAALAAALALLPVAALVALTVPRDRQEFPHEAHAGLFPLCAGCHQGVETGFAAELYPEPASCAACHDGVEFALASFTVPAPEPTNLRFDHVVHARAVAAAGGEEPVVSCATCHADAGAPRMTVDPLAAERCLGCHTRPNTPHLVGAPCATCHLTLAESRLPLERIAAFEVPADHESGRFILETHGALAVEETSRCATCHTQDRCVSCHVDAGRAEIALIPLAPPDMELPPAVAHYPVPASHRTPAFREAHGRGLGASGAADCATCHTRDDCASCHLSPLPAAALALPLRATVVAPGVGLFQGAPASHQVPRFDRAHGTLAAADPAACATCHTQPFCVQCHSAPQQPVYHEANFVARHAADAWSRSTECASCHEVQVFCRSCHVQSGFGAQGRLGQGFHDAEPLWLLRHGQPARQSLESCASCHQQKDCLQCHSQLGAFRVNPHGPNFDARRAWARNPGICTACHLGNPFGGS
jgi:hypothetical protein